MLTRPPIIARLALLTILLASTPALSAIPQPPGDPAFWSAYNQGLMSLRDGRFPDAVTSLTAAIKRTPDPRAYLARAAAYTLQEKFDDAIDDLSHANLPAQPGQRPSREPQLWRLLIWAMSDKAPDDAQPNGPNRSVWFSGIPGNMVQGGNDYPTDYASFLAYEMATPYRDAHQTQNQSQNQTPTARPPSFEPLFKRAGQWFANRNLATAPMAPFNLQVASQLLQKEDPSGALEAANLAQAVYPFDPDIRFIMAEAYRKLGRPETARRQYTIALTMATDMAPAYRGRALAAAAQGDSRRAIDDLRSAAAADPKPNPQANDAVTALLSKESVAAAPSALLAKLDSASQAGSSVDQLLPLALDLQRASASFRVRFDELYQDRLHHLEDSARRTPNDADALVSVAAWLLDELDNRGESVEPRRGMLYYRYQFSPRMEVSRAISFLDRALKLNPKHPAALVRLAYAYDAIDDTRKAEDCIQQVILLVGAKNADAIRLLAEYRARQAGSMRSQAQSLRSPKFVSNSHTENRSDGVYEVTVTTQYNPSSADLAQAAELEQAARAMVAEAKSLMEAAIKANPSSLEGMLLQASYENWFGTPEKTLTVLQDTVKKFPSALKAHDALIDFELTHGMSDEATAHRMTASKLFQTTAGPLLERVWATIGANGWPPVLADLQPARLADPADARASAYLALAQADAKETDASAASLRVAIALELARLQLDEQGPGKTLPRPATDFSLIMRLLNLSAIKAAQASQFDRAIADGTLAASFAARFAPGGNGQLMFGAMFPDPKAPQIPVPAPLNGATLASQVYVSLGQILKSQNHPEEALKYFQAVAHLAQPRGRNIPQVSNARGDSNYSDKATGPAVAMALIEVARAELAQNHLTAASDALNAAGSAQPDPQQRTEINQLNLDLARRMSDSRMQDSSDPQQPQPTPPQLPPRQFLPRQLPVRPTPPPGRNR